MNWYIYWIKRKTFVDPYIEGYVGITNNYRRRINHHFSYSKRGASINSHLNNAIRLYDDIEVVILFNGTEEECWKKESVYRPEKNIGWNIERGGIKNPRCGFQGKTHTQEYKNKMRDLFTGRYISPETKRKSVETRRKNNTMADNISKFNILIVECPYCKKIGGAPGMKRFHFEHCKKKLKDLFG